VTHRGYDQETAERLVLLSDAAYADTSSGEAEEAAERTTGADKVIAVDFGGVEVVVAKFGEDVSISFRGSSEPDDFLHDLRIGLRPVEGFPGKVHGLAGGALRAFPVIDRIVEDFLGPNGFIDIGGHSKGGAEASFAAFLFIQSGQWRLRSCHSFGAPAIGNRAFAKEYDHAVPGTFSHIFGSDLIARSPVILRALKFYQRTGRIVYHTRTGRTLFRPSPVRYFLDGLRAISRRRGLRDHGLNNYIEAITEGET